MVHPERHELEDAMTRFRITDDDGTILGEGSFGTFGEAKAWAAEEMREGGWTLHHRTASGRWVVLRRSPSQPASENA